MFSILKLQSTGEIQTEYTGDELVPALDAWCTAIHDDDYSDCDTELQLVCNDTVYASFVIPESQQGF